MRADRDTELKAVRPAESTECRVERASALVLCSCSLQEFGLTLKSHPLSKRFHPLSGPRLSYSIRISVFLLQAAKRSRSEMASLSGDGDADELSMKSKTKQHAEKLHHGCGDFKPYRMCCESRDRLYMYYLGYSLQLHPALRFKADLYTVDTRRRHPRNEDRAGYGLIS
eukprot:SAG11_NODE_474_length_9142_cov_6.507907_7_plen_169_part_00